MFTDLLTLSTNAPGSTYPTPKNVCVMGSAATDAKLIPENILLTFCPKPGVVSFCCSAGKPHLLLSPLFLFKATESILPSELVASVTRYILSLLITLLLLTE